MCKKLLPLLLVAFGSGCSELPSSSAARTTVEIAVKPQHYQFPSAVPCEVRDIQWTGPRFVTAGQYTYSVSPEVNPPGPGQTCPVNPEFFWDLERNGVETRIPCGYGSSCAITVNPGDASFRVAVRYRYAIQNEGGPTPSFVAYDNFSVTVDAAPFAAFVSGPQYLYPNTSCTWTGSAANGTPPYSYSWSGLLNGSSYSVTGSVARSGNLFLTVTDSQGRVGTTQFAVETGAGYSSSCSPRGY